MTQLGLTLGDVTLAARYLARFKRKDWAAKCALLFEQADQAAAYRALTGRVHALLGDGSLGALALRHGVAPMPARLSCDMRDALGFVLVQQAKRAGAHTSLSFM